MSETANRAVFLSYASQDAEAAKRICDALRAAGVEVWFDQSELVGGDAWDAKIRGQISSCALFVPIISASTQARREGYFRLEWKLAAQRTHMIADGTPFLLPVVIDDTRDAEALVPGEFKGVQWTRLPAGDTPTAFCARVAKLLGGSESYAPVAASDAPAPAPSAPARSRAAWIGYGWAAVGILFALVYAVRPMFQEPRSKPAKPAVEPAPVSESRRLTQQARELLIKPGRGSSKWEAAALLCERALALDPTDAEALALASQVDSRLWFHVFDRTPKRSESARIRAARALDLAPTSFESRLAQATFLVLVAGRPQSEQAESVLRQLRLEAPTDLRPVNLLGSLMGALQRYEEALAFSDELARLPGNESEGLVQKSWNLHWLRRIPEMETALDRSIELRPIAGSVTLRVYYDLSWWGEGDRALASLNRLPAEELAEDNGISAAVRVHRWRRDPEALLRFLGTVPRDWIWWGIRGPKAALTGDAHAAAGRMIAARTDWQGALALVERRLIEAPNDQNLLEWKAYLHARLGDAAAARDAYQRSLESMPIERSSLEIEKLAYIAPEDEVLGELERRVEATVADLEAKRRMSARFISAADLRLNPAWDPVRSLPRFQALLARLDADPRFNPNAKPAASPAAKVDDKSVAVLAFANLSDDKGNEYFSDGISEELLNVLAKVPGLAVRGRSSGFYFKGMQIKSADIGQQLNVAYLVQGSVRRAGDRVRISAQLIRAATDEVLWSSGSLDRDLKDIFAVQDEIARLIAQNLQLKLGDGRVHAKAVNPEAHRLVLEGRHYLALRGEANFARGEAAFRAAAEIAPDLAVAHAGSAEVLAQRGRYQQIAGLAAPGSQLEEVQRHATRALQLDPSLSEPHAALAVALADAGRLAEAEEETERGIAANPNYGSQYLWRSHLHVARGGRLDLALVDLQRATDLDPLAFIHLYIQGAHLGYAGRWAEALPLLDRGASLRGERFLPLEGERALARFLTGRRDEAMTLARKILADPELLTLGWWTIGEALWMLRQGGAGEEAARLGEGILARLAPDNYLRGYVLCGLGRFEEGLPLLRTIPTIARNRFCFVPIFDPARGTPAFQRLISDLKVEKEYALARATLARLLKEREAKK